MDRDGRGYEDRRARVQPARILIPDLVAERLRSLQERPELPGRGGHGSAPRDALPGVAGGGGTRPYRRSWQLPMACPPRSTY